MTVTLDLNPETEQGLLLQAQERGVSLDAYLQDLLNNHVVIGKLLLMHRELTHSLQRTGIYDDGPQRPLKTGRGLLAKYGPAPSAEEIDENRHDMFGSFAQDF